MPKFTYIGGITHSEHYSEPSEGVVDETQGVEMPSDTTAFGIKFIVGQPVDVTVEKFASKASYDHAIMKLRGNKFFKPYADDIAFEEVKDEPKPKPKTMPKVSSASPKFSPPPKPDAD